MNRAKKYVQNFLVTVAAAASHAISVRKKESTRNIHSMVSRIFHWAFSCIQYGQFVTATVQLPGVSRWSNATDFSLVTHTVLVLLAWNLPANN